MANEEVTVFEVTKGLRGASLTEFQERLTRRAEAGQVKIVLDLAAFDHADSAGLGYLVKLRRELVAQGGDCAIARPNAEFRRLIRITGLDMILPVYGTLDEAIRHFPA